MRSADSPECNDFVRTTMTDKKWHHRSSVKTRRKRRFSAKSPLLPSSITLLPTTTNSYFLILSSWLVIMLFWGAQLGSGFDIAPPWANPEVNQCSRSSWQLIHWPEDNRLSLFMNLPYLSHCSNLRLGYKKNCRRNQRLP